MARFPRIDTPCPLSAEDQRTIDGHCTRCDKHVHALDRLDESERRALLATVPGPICVSYRLPVPRRVGRVGAAIAATLITTTAATTVYAGEPEHAVQRPFVTSSPQHSPVPSQPVVSEGRDEQELEFVTFLGGVTDPEDALAAEDTSVPELPVRTAASFPRDLESSDE